MAVRARIERWGDWALTLALLVGIESEVAFDAPAGLEVRGGRGALALVAALLVLPLAWRCRAPLVVLAAMLTAFVVAMLLITENRGVPLSLVIAFGVAFYSVGAHASGRRSVGAVVLGLATVAVIDILSGGVFQSVGGARPGVWVLLAVAWQVGREVQKAADRDGETARSRGRARARSRREAARRRRRRAREDRARVARRRRSQCQRDGGPGTGGGASAGR